jgi:hypothetical protein
MYGARTPEAAAFGAGSPTARSPERKDKAAFTAQATQCGEAAVCGAETGCYRRRIAANLTLDLAVFAMKIY